jgi:outer membrane protein assembly factor BamB
LPNVLAKAPATRLKEISMKKLVALAGLLLIAAVTLAQDVRLHTNPTVPPKDVLEKLSLKKAWHLTVPVDHLRDGFCQLQLIPGPKFTLLLAQTCKGAVVAINGETGDTLWRTTIGLPYQVTLPAGWNEQSIFVTRQDTLYALDRDDGTHQIYSVDKATNQPIYGMVLEGAPSAGLVADEEFLFITMGDRVVRFAVPPFRQINRTQERVPAAGKKLEPSPPLLPTWNYNTFGSQLLQAPVLTREMAVITSVQGNVYMVKKADGETLSRFKTEGPVSAGVAFNKWMVYVPCEDYFLYALDAATGRLVWRFAGQAPIVRKPEATDQDVFVSPGKTGLVRLHRKSGEPEWKNKDAQRFLSTNQRFVYALDNQGKLLVLDYERGKELARYDMRDWILPISNDLTDRIYLASNDGQIICLHHRDLTKPLMVKTFEVMKVRKDKGGEPPPK